MGHERTGPQGQEAAIGRGLVGDAQRKIEKTFDDLLASINADETISDITKAEFRNRISQSRARGPSELTPQFQEAASISKDFAAAIEGSAPQFRARQTQKSFRSILADRPGRGQTILTR